MTLTRGGSFADKVNFIWSVADLLRGDYKPSEYGKVILPLVVIRRLDCVLAETKDQVVDAVPKFARLDNPENALATIAGHEFYNTSPLDFAKLTDDPENVLANLREYIGGFSPSAREVIDKFRFDVEIKRLADNGLLYLVLSKFADLDLGTEHVGTTEMGYIYEELIRRFSEQSNETAGEHFTPREVIRLMVNLLFVEDDSLLRDEGVVKTLFDPACGTGGMLAVAEEHLASMNDHAHLEVYGQELNDESYAICRSDMMLKGHSSTNIASGNSFSQDGFAGRTFDYMLANPPFGVEWKKVKSVVEDEAKNLGFEGRFGAGTPRITDASLLFLQHMISKMKPEAQGGSRLAIVFNGSPLFTGGAGSGESEIRRWIIENDWLEAVVALPDQLFYNTGIATYFWIVTNRKRPERRGLVQLIDARSEFEKMPKSLGEKRKSINDTQIDEITRMYGDFTESDQVKILPNESFGFQRITIERPLRVLWKVTDDSAVELTTTVGWAMLDGDEQVELAERLAENVGAVADSREGLAEILGPVPVAVSKDLWSILALPDDDGPVQVDSKGRPKPDPSLRDQENVPLPFGTPEWDRTDEGAAKRLADPHHRARVEQYMEEEILPWVAEAWVDHAKTKIGYEIPLTRNFYRYTPRRPVAEIDAELDALESRARLLLVAARQ